MLCSRALTLLSAPANAVSEVENISYETEARIDAKNVAVQPDVHSLRTRINRAHHRHLRRTFLKIALIDTGRRSISGAAHSGFGAGRWPGGASGRRLPVPDSPVPQPRSRWVPSLKRDPSSKTRRAQPMNSPNSGKLEYDPKLGLRAYTGTCCGIVHTIMAPKLGQYLIYNQLYEIYNIL